MYIIGVPRQFCIVIKLILYVVNTSISLDDMNDSYKKIRHNLALTSISIDGNVNSISSTVVSLIIKNNQTINSLDDLQSLSYAKLINTNISAITNCNWLTSLVIYTNEIISQLSKLDQLADVICINCPELIDINLKNNSEILIESCDKIQSISVPTCEMAVLKYCRALSVICFGSNLKCLTLLDINSITQLILPDDLQLDLLDITDCSQLYLNMNPIKCKKISLRNCPAIISLDMQITCESININECCNLISIENISAVNCNISLCHRLRDISNVSITKLVINYCIHLHKLHTDGVIRIHIDYCPRLQQIIIAPGTQETILNECILLDTIDTEPLPFGVIRNQKITMIGTSAIDELHNLFASELMIINNNQIISIDTIHDLISLKLINCNQLETVSNSVVSDRFIIKNCRNLHTIADIIAPSNITLINLPCLTTSRFIFTAVRKLTIKHCKNLISSFIGQWLDKLILIDTDIIRIVGLSDTTSVCISNSKFLPEIDVDLLNTNSTAGAIELKNYIGMREIAVGRIINSIRKYQIRFIKIRIQDALKQQTCTICLSEIDRPERFVSKCFHTFHSECIFKWVSIRNSCPLCNATNLY